jgi:hypothetical protein
LKLAVLDFARGGGDPPFELVEALLCEEYSIAPRAGSLDAQDFAQFARYGTLKALYRACAKLLADGFKALGADERRLVVPVMILDDERQRRG